MSEPESIPPTPAEAVRATHVAMIGPDLDARGGISTVARAWLDSPSLSGVKVDYVGTMRDGRTLPKAARMAARQARFVARLARGWRPQLFHVHLSYFTSFYRKLAYVQEARATGAPVVLHIHAPDLGAFHDAARIHAAAMRFLFQQADRVVALSQSMAAEVRTLAGPDVRLDVLYNPVVLEQFACAPRAATDTPTVLFMGELGQRKGTWDLVQAIPHVLAAVPGARFRFGGNGDEARLRQEIAALGIEASVDVLGWVGMDKKKAAYDSADIYCLPSYQEGLPMSILEAMGSGLPCVSTPIAGIPEAVRDQETGLLVDPGDVPALTAALTRLCADPGLRRRMGTAGRRFAEERFDVDHVVLQLRDIWDDVLQSANRS